MSSVLVGSEHNGMQSLVMFIQTNLEAISNWPSVVIALVPVLIMVMQYFQSLQSRRIEEKVEHVNAKSTAIEQKVDENTIVTHETKLKVNSAAQIQMELRIVDLKELLVEKPDNISVLARLAAAEKLLADHKLEEAVAKDRTKTAVITGPIVVSEVLKPVEIKTKS